MPRRIPLFIPIVGAILGVALLYGIGVLRPLQDNLRWLLMPAARIFAAAGFVIGGNQDTTNVSTLRSQMKDMEARLAAVSVDYVKLRSLEEENRLLRETAKFLSTSGYDHVGARVIARNTEGRTATVLIDRGAGDGLEKGMAVIVGDGIFVGKITALSQYLSTVMLVSDERSRIAASPPGARRLFGMVQGLGNGVSQLTLVPQSEQLKSHDIIVTAGTEEKIPSDLAIASVDEIGGKATDPFKTATLQPLAQTDELSLVEVLRPAALRPAANR